MYSRATADPSAEKFLSPAGYFHYVSKTSTESKQTVSGFISAALSTLASRDLLSVAGPVMTTGGTLIATKTAFIVLSPDAFDGPFLVGIASGSLSAAQIEAAIENQGPISPAHSVNTEVASRWRHIRVLGVIGFNDDAAGSAGILWVDEAIKLAWAEEDAGYQYWIYNLGPTLTAGSTFEITHKDFVIFDRD